MAASPSNQLANQFDVPSGVQLLGQGVGLEGSISGFRDWCRSVPGAGLMQGSCKVVRHAPDRLGCCRGEARFGGQEQGSSASASGS